jgi:DNA-binding MarR family transcriptional regulator
LTVQAPVTLVWVGATDPTGQLSDLELAAWRGMLETHSALVAELDAELERDHGLPLTSYEVLMYLGDSEHGKLRMGELADHLLLSRSGITRLVDRLERQGLVERQPCEDDGRGYYAVLTDRGGDKLRIARPDHLAGVRRHFLDPLDPDDLDALFRAWERLAGQRPGGGLDEHASDRQVASDA